MAERIARRREERPAGWKTVEEPATVLVAISTLAVVALARRCLGGATGDVCGATAELGQLAALLAFAATTLK